MQGALGVVKGLGRSCEFHWVQVRYIEKRKLGINVTARPAAGVMGVMALPIHGAFKSLRRKMAGSPQNTLRDPRTALSRQSASQVSTEDTAKILSAYEEAMKGASERRRILKERAKKFLDGDEEALEDTEPITELQTPHEDGEREAESRVQVDLPLEGVADVAHEKKKSEVEEAERRGYERAMQEIEIGHENETGVKGF